MSTEEELRNKLEELEQLVSELADKVCVESDILELNSFCSHCSIDLTTAQGYVCYSEDCPTGMGPNGDIK